MTDGKSWKTVVLWDSREAEQEKEPRRANVCYLPVSVICIPYTQ